MGKNEKTSKGIGKIASKGLRTGHLTPRQTRQVSGAALTQRPDKGSKSPKKR